MKIEPEAFLAIERTMASAMRAEWAKRASALIDTLAPLTEKKDWAGAQEAVNKLHFGGLVTDVRPKIEEMAHSALLFGAHHAAGSVKATSFMNGKAIPRELHNAIDQLVHMVEADGRDQVCNQLHAAIEAMKRADATSHMQKNDIYTQKDKRPDAQVAEAYDPEADPDQTGAQMKAKEKFYGQAAYARKDDVSTADMAKTGGLLEPEQAGPGKKKRGVKADDGVTLADKLNEAVRAGGNVPVDLGASLTTSRLVSLGFLAEAVEKGITTYVVNEVLDGRTCRVCQYMHGKTFDVRRQFDRVVRQLSSGDPADLKVTAPWPGQSADDVASMMGQSLDELQSQGLGGPPYHPGCRGMLMLVGTATEEIPLGGGAVAPVPVSLPSHGDALTEIEAAPAVAEQPREDDSGFSQDEIDQIKWDRFQVTDPDAFAQVDDAFNAGDYETAKELIADWKAAQLTKDETQPSDNQGFEGPNAPKKKRKLQTPAGLETDYDDISSDSSNQAFDNDGVGNQNDVRAPLDRN